MSAGKVNLLAGSGAIDQGSDWYQNFVYQDSTGAAINITNYTAEMQLRSNIADTIPALSLTIGSGITITGSTGTIALHATNAQTAAISAGMYNYDLEITSPTGIITRLVYGQIQVCAQVSR
jgi:hypothetical protein